MEVVGSFFNRIGGSMIWGIVGGVGAEFYRDIRDVIYSDFGDDVESGDVVNSELEVEGGVFPKNVKSLGKYVKYEVNEEIWWRHRLNSWQDF